MRTIQQQCAMYFALVYPGQKLSPEQLRECQRAFHAGAEAVVRILWDISSNDVSEDAGVHMLEGLHEELQQYARQMMREAGIKVPEPAVPEGAGRG